MANGIWFCVFRVRTSQPASRCARCTYAATVNNAYGLLCLPAEPIEHKNMREMCASVAKLINRNESN